MAEVFSIGHSTHGIDDFVALLSKHGIESIADIRRFPGSRRNPQFAKEQLQGFLSTQGIEYLHLADLGGRRDPLPDSPNQGWEVAAFRGYADHMRTDAFKTALKELKDIALRSPTACMCAEGLWWKCHRRVLSDALVAEGWTVRHIMPNGESQEHRLSDFAVIEGGELTYPASQPELPMDRK